MKKSKTKLKQHIKKQHVVLLLDYALLFCKLSNNNILDCSEEEKGSRSKVPGKKKNGQKPPDKNPPDSKSHLGQKLPETICSL